MTKKQKRQLVGTVTHPAEDKYKPKVPCGAKTRAGSPCTRPALPGKQRCKLHGGASTGPPKGSENGKIHRLYGAGFTPSELAFLNEADNYKGTLEGELETLRVALYRASICQKIWLEHKGILARMEDEAPMEEYMREHGLWDTITLHTETGHGWDSQAEELIDINKKRVERRQRDYTKEIKEISEKIRRLEETHQKLIAERQDPDNVAKIAEDLQAFYANAAALMPGGAVEDAAAE